MSATTLTTKRKGGRSPTEINYGTLSELCGLMCTGEECASILGVSYDTLARALKRDHGLTFPEFFRRHSVPALVRLRQAQFDSAVSGSIPMLIWLGKQWLGQREPDKQIQDDGVTELLRRILTT